MAEYLYKERTAGNLPHLYPVNGTFFVTFRLAGSIPQSVLRLYDAQKKWLEQESKRLAKVVDKTPTPENKNHAERLRQFRREWFARFEAILDKADHGPVWLKDDRVAETVANALLERDGHVYRLDAYSVMSNHVHAVLAPFVSAVDLREIWDESGRHIVSQNPPLDSIMKSLKGYTAWKANRLLGRKGKFWARESYDHVVRSDREFDRVVRYTLANPVKAGLVKDWCEWRWSYSRLHQAGRSEPRDR